MSDTPFVSILVLVHNAPEYVRLAIESVRSLTRDIRYELVVVDNASDEPTVSLLESLQAEGSIDKLHLSPVNTLFAAGNNLAASLASPEATHYLLLNSDVEIRSDRWLSTLIRSHQTGATAFGVAFDPLRIDGYCLLVDADVYQKFPLDEGHQWWWSVTKQQAMLLRAGYRVAGFYEHEQYLHHFGGKSGSAFLSAKGMSVSRREVSSWFDRHKPEILDRIPLVLVARASIRRVGYVLKAASGRLFSRFVWARK